MAFTATVTGNAGPGNTLTAAVFNDCNSFAIDGNKLVLNRAGGVTTYIDITDETTVTVTKTSAGVTGLTVAA